MSRPRPRPLLAGLGAVVLASCVGAALVLPTGAHADTAPGVTGAMRSNTVNAAVTDVTFTLTNDTGRDAPAEVVFTLPHGQVHDRTGGRGSVRVDGHHVVLRPAGGVVPAGSTVDLPLYVLNGQGALPADCAIGVTPVAGCTTTQPQPPVEQTVEQPAEEPGEESAPSPEDPAAPADPESPGPVTEGPFPVVTSGHTDVPIRPLGDARAVQQADGTQAARSDLRQASRWITRGQTFVVEVSESVTDAQVGVGLYGNHFGINGCRDVGIWTQDLHPGRNLVTAPHDGLVSVVDRSATDEGTVVVRGGLAVPTYVAGRTDRADFDTQLRNWDRSPFMVLVGERVQADVLRADRTQPDADQNEQLVAGVDLDAKLARWDDVVRTNERYWGATGPHRVHFATPSYGVAGSPEYADVHQGWVAFPVDAADPHHLLSGDTSVAGEQHLRTAVGQVFQQDVTRWTNPAGQVDRQTSQGLASLLVEERVNGTNHLDAWTAKVRSFRAQPVEQRSFWWNGMNPTVRSLAFDQLRRAYGDDVVARIAAQARQDAPEQDARRSFVRAAATVTDRDLTRFFAEWGIPVEADLRAELATHPAPDTAIWDDVDAMH